MEYLILIIPAVFLLLEAIIGFKRGLVISVLSLLSWVLAISGSGLLVEEFATSGNSMDTYTQLFSGIVGEANAGVATIATMYLVMLVMIKLFCMVIMHFAKLVDKIPVIGTLNRILGALFGILKGLLVIVLILFVYAVYSGVGLDVIYDQFPQLMIFVDMMKQYISHIWSIAQ